MEKKINVAAILKDKPQGTKLYDLLYNIDVELDTISTTDTETVVWCTNETDKNTTCHRGYSEFGTVRGCPDGLQILLPSKEMRHWGKFSWKKGDVLVNKDGDVHIIFERFADDTYCSFVGKYYFWKENNDTEHFYKNERLLTSDFQKGGKDVAQTYINTIEERLDGKLNRETLEIEKTQTEFKDGDIAFADFGKTQDVFIVSGKTNLSEGYYSFIVLNLNSTKALSIGYKTSFFKENLNTLRLATEEEKQQLFEALAKEGKHWDAEKKQIVDLKPKYEFKPMDLCLMKYIGKYNNRGWELCQYAYTEHRVSSSGEQRDFYHAVGGEIYAECIPYKGNEHLLGTKKSK